LTSHAESERNFERAKAAVLSLVDGVVGKELMEDAERQQAAMSRDATWQAEQDRLDKMNLEKIANRASSKATKLFLRK